MPSTSTLKSGTGLLVMGAILLTAANLRAPITGVSPIVEQLQQVFGFSASSGGLLVAIPLLAFGLISPLAPHLSRRLGLERTLLSAMLLITVGLILRASHSEAALFIGTAIIGVGIALGNVLMPGAIKRYYAHHQLALVTGYASLTMGVIAALLSATVVPTSHLFGWQFALLVPLLFSLLGAALWWPMTKRSHSSAHTEEHNQQHSSLWRSKLAWQVTLFMGINSLLYYVLVAWLPTLLTDNGISPSVAGSYHGAMQLASALPGLLLTPFIKRMTDQRLVAALMSLLMLAGLIGLNEFPALALVWSCLLGFGSGGIILLSFIYMSLRTSSAHQAALLSGMAQCVGYLLAACGPVVIGWLHDMTGNWQLILWLATAAALLMMVCGVLAGRRRVIGEK